MHPSIVTAPTAIIRLFCAIDAMERGELRAYGLPSYWFGEKFEIGDAKEERRSPS